jgi:hypothetical protein
VERCLGEHRQPWTCFRCLWGRFPVEIVAIMEP